MKTPVFILTAFVYSFFYLIINGEIFGNSPFNYYSLLIDSLLSGRLDIPGNVTIDLSQFQGKWYLNWGPGALLYIFPFKLIMLGGLSDKFYTLLAGILNILVFSFLIKEFIKYFKINLSDFSKNFLLFSFAIASPNFYLSLNGRVWFTEQIVAVLYILLSLLFLFRFLNSDGKLKYFLISVIFFNLAWFTRAPLVFHGLILFAAILVVRSKGYAPRLFAFLITTTSIFLLILFTYNFLRFENIFETGLNHHLANPRYESAISEGKVFSVVNIPFNFYHFFLNFPQISKNFPFLSINLEGNSIFAFYPLLLVIPLFIKNFLQIVKKNMVLLSFVFVFSVEISLLLIYFATGWTQVGMRYFLDLIPISFLMTAFVLDRVPKSIIVLTVLYSALINVAATLIYYEIWVN